MLTPEDLKNIVKRSSQILEVEIDEESALEIARRSRGTPRIANRFASIGVGPGESALTNDFVESGKYSELYKIIPFHLVDGINEFGVIVNSNVVPLDKEENTRTLPTVSEEIELCSRMVPRFVLDNFKTAKEAATYLKEHAAIYPAKDLKGMHYDLHYMIADKEETSFHL